MISTESQRAAAAGFGGDDAMVEIGWWKATSLFWTQVRINIFFSGNVLPLKLYSFRFVLFFRWEWMEVLGTFLESRLETW